MKLHLLISKTFKNSNQDKLDKELHTRVFSLYILSFCIVENSVHHSFSQNLQINCYGQWPSNVTIALYKSPVVACEAQETRLLMLVGVGQ